MRAFLFANPAAHSRSPAMHNAAFRHAGLDAHYEARQVLPEALADAVAGLRQADVLGANLSLPHKEAALPLMDALTPAARAIGAVNTVIHRDGVLTGDNTDAPGFLEALRTAGDDAHGTALVLGAGGAARAAVWALRSQGREVLVLNRTYDKAIALTRDLGGVAVPPAGPVGWERVALLVNASSAGLDAPHESPLPDLPRLAPEALVYDMVYKPAETRLMRDARAAGYRAENGLGMLAQQARLAFQAWTARDVPITVFLDALARPVRPEGTE
ncbi:shikimate dehydrogenase [Deinococcus aquiradiocola]|uniref:Shikimate dehydrogenase (NADP(+)) n=1 Tax=Deinococcus aquiradiocola TaxID=393059 RepID=A0A917PFC9_9DEIO|nr:shikimate dehydrogenase [Deinococcus aquiradiocola]GGJ74435.1 shikimate dehydrogenase (NADP(+)) [Deinococcus aquiradiocola]